LTSGSRGKRYAYPHSKIMIHGVQTSELSGTQDEIEAESKRIKQLNQSLMEIIARHSKQTLTKVKRDFKKDKYFTADEALKYGLIDEVIEPTKKIPALKR
jgi:ATP-dependent Clp protease protease subunit